MSSFAEKMALTEIASDVVRIQALHELLESLDTDDFYEISDADFVAVMDLFAETDDIVLVLAKARCLDEYHTFEAAKEVVISFSDPKAELPSFAHRRNIIEALLAEYTGMVEQLQDDFLTTFGYSVGFEDVRIEGVEGL
jgi:hypothetical protein